MLNINLLRVIITILAENGETRALTLIKLINSYTDSIRVNEPVVFEHIIFRNSEKYKISLPLDNFRTDWGDGEINTVKEHEYKNIYGIYRVKIYNSAGKIEKRGSWPNNIIKFISIGRIGIDNLSYMFYANQFNFLIYPNWDTTKITDMSYMFFGAKKFNQKIGDNWDTSRVTNMCFMFGHTENFNQKIGDNWDTSRVTSMESMFCYAFVFNQKFGDNWDTSRVTSMRNMFHGAIYFNQKIGDNWDVSHVTDLGYMFSGAIRFNQKIGDNWDTSSITNLSYMFYHALSLSQKIGDNWNISDNVFMDEMFTWNFEKKLLPSWYKKV